MRHEVARIFDCIGRRCIRCEEPIADGKLCLDCSEEMSSDDTELYEDD